MTSFLLIPDAFSITVDLYTLFFYIQEVLACIFLNATYLFLFMTLQWPQDFKNKIALLETNTDSLTTTDSKGDAF